MNQKTVKRLRKATKIANEVINGRAIGENKRLFRRIKNHYNSLNSRQRADFKNRRV